MKNLSSIFNNQTVSFTRSNRRIFVGEFTPSTKTWVVPEGTSQVEVHAWGGGGNGTPGPGAYGGAGGGGGGYVSHLYTVNAGDVLNITLGGVAGTTSVSVPTNPLSPQPISATGGSPGTVVSTSPTVNITGGGGGSGSFASVPVPLRSPYYTRALSGSSGGSVTGPTASYISSAGGGGSAFLSFTSTAGSNSVLVPPASPPTYVSSPSRPGGSFPNLFFNNPSAILSNISGRNNYQNAPALWFYLEEIETQSSTNPATSGGFFNKTSYSPIVTSPATLASAFTFASQYPASGTSPFVMAFGGNNSGMLTGGAGGFVSYTNSTAQVSGKHGIIAGGGGGGGYSTYPIYGGPGSGGQGGVGCVIIYW